MFALRSFTNGLETFEKIIKKLLCRRLECIHDKASSNSKMLPRTTVIVHGVRYPRQADELYTSVETLRDYLQDHDNSILIVVVSHPRLLRHVLDKHDVISLENFYSLHVFESGTVYSGKHLNPTAFYEVRDRYIWMRRMGLIYSP